MISIIQRSVLLLGIAFLISSCAHLVHLDRAQNAFSRGAEIENRAQFNIEAISPESPSGHYSVAYAEVKQALKGRSKLQRDTVLASALTLKALCEWKLHRYNSARQTRMEALGILEKYKNEWNIPMSRDLALVRALNGLIKIDEVNDQWYQEVEQATSNLEAAGDRYLELIHNPEDDSGEILQALKIIREARNSVHSSNEIQTYLILSQLSALKNWSDAYDYLNNLAEQQDVLLPEAVEISRRTFRKERNLHLCMLQEQLPGGAGNDIFEYWTMLFAVTEDDIEEDCP